MSENIVLTGFMGTGKTTVGRIIARQLGRRFIDMDECLIDRFEKSIDQVFSEDGEAAFRSAEADLCEELSQIEDLVVATGGGTLLNEKNRQLLEKTGRLICLNADVDVVLKRIQNPDNPVRPLIHSGDERAIIRQLLEEREPAYREIPWQIDTSDLRVEQVVQRVSNNLQTTRLTVSNPSASYPIWIGSGLLEHCGDLLFQAGASRGSKVVVVSNPAIASNYFSILSQNLNSRGYDTALCTIGDGESFKTLSTVANLYEHFLSLNIQRDDTVVALGGGVVGDVSGYAAATYLRGIRFAQVPTTLLSMIDSSVGGKTGVNLPQGKNLVGAFKQPSFVLIDPSTLQTLPEAEIKSGLAEIIKHGVIADPVLFEMLESLSGNVALLWQSTSGASLISRAIKVKMVIVEEDPFEQGIRTNLNFGHTIGHALEQVSQYKLRHGEAVGIGMIAEAKISSKMKISKSEITDRLQSILLLWKLPVNCPPYPVEEIVQAMGHDKKKKGGKFRWVLPEAIGKVDVYSGIPIEMVKITLKEMGAQ